MIQSLQTLVGESYLAHLLRGARQRQLALFSDVEGDQLLGPQQHHIEPPIWEMGHVAWFQEYWILRHLDGRGAVWPAGDAIYDAFNVSYKLRWSHAYPPRDEVLDYADEVLRLCTQRLEGRAPSAEEQYFYTLVALHEGMHTENLLGVRQTLEYPRPRGLSLMRADADPDYTPHDVAVPGGTYRIGAPQNSGFVFDNEKWAHEVEIEPFHIASVPVTHAEYAQFVDAGGYENRSWWDRRGWDWRRRGGHAKPVNWEKRGGVWHERLFDRWIPLRANHPICHVNWYEAKAYCRFAGRRLPTEAEWEVAASFDPATGQQYSYPWGDAPPAPDQAHVDLAHAGTADVSAYAAGDSPLGCRQMIGNVWEWTSSVLEPYPGFEADPYQEYSVPYFGKKPVLRGGCYATSGALSRNTYRNFFIRNRRNIFAGLRTCAR